MELVISDNHLDVTMLSAFDPWVYDVDGDCYISQAEAEQAAYDYANLLITYSQFGQVAELWQQHTRDPACAPPPTDYLDMSKDELYAYLIDKSVYRDWWSLSKTNRRVLGLKIIQWWSVDWFGSGLCIGRGAPNCSQVPQFDPYQQDPAGKDCLLRKIGLGMEHCAGLRYCLFTNNNLAPRDLYWWRGLKDQWYCYDSGVCFGLPTGVAIGGADFLNCLQVDQDVSKLDSWIFFQTWLVDGYPSCDGRLWPSTSGGIAIKEVDRIGDLGAVDLGSLIAEIYYG